MQRPTSAFTHPPASPALARPRVCVIGAGPSGITAAKNLLAAGFDDVVVYDRNTEVGGNWIFRPGESHSSVFETTHIISSKRHVAVRGLPDAGQLPGLPRARAAQGVLPELRRGTSGWTGCCSSEPR